MELDGNYGLDGNYFVIAPKNDDNNCGIFPGSGEPTTIPISPPKVL